MEKLEKKKKKKKKKKTLCGYPLLLCEFLDTECIVPDTGMVAQLLECPLCDREVVDPRLSYTESRLK